MLLPGHGARTAADDNHPDQVMRATTPDVPLPSYQDPTRERGMIPGTANDATGGRAFLQPPATGLLEVLSCANANDASTEEPVVTRHGILPGRWTRIGSMPFVTARRQAFTTLLTLPSTDAAVSKMHADLFLFRTGDLLLQDLGSRNGTFLGGQRLPPYELFFVPPGAVVHFGRTPTRWCPPAVLAAATDSPMAAIMGDSPTAATTAPSGYTLPGLVSQSLRQPAPSLAPADAAPGGVPDDTRADAPADLLANDSTFVGASQEDTVIGDMADSQVTDVQEDVDGIDMIDELHNNTAMFDETQPADPFSALASAAPVSAATDMPPPQFDHAVMTNLGTSLTQGGLIPLSSSPAVDGMRRASSPGTLGIAPTALHQYAPTDVSVWDNEESQVLLVLDTGDAGADVEYPALMLRPWSNVDEDMDVTPRASRIATPMVEDRAGVAAAATPPPPVPVSRDVSPSTLSAWTHVSLPLGSSTRSGVAPLPPPMATMPSVVPLVAPQLPVTLPAAPHVSDSTDSPTALSTLAHAAAAAAVPAPMPATSPAVAFDPAAPFSPHVIPPSVPTSPVPAPMSPHPSTRRAMSSPAPRPPPVPRQSLKRHASDHLVGAAAPKRARHESKSEDAAMDEAVPLQLSPRVAWHGPLVDAEESIGRGEVGGDGGGGARDHGEEADARQGTPATAVHQAVARGEGEEVSNTAVEPAVAAAISTDITTPAVVRHEPARADAVYVLANDGPTRATGPGTGCDDAPCLEGATGEENAWEPRVMVPVPAATSVPVPAAASALAPEPPHLRSGTVSALTRRGSRHARTGSHDAPDTSAPGAHPTTIDCSDADDDVPMIRKSRRTPAKSSAIAAVIAYDNDGDDPVQYKSADEADDEVQYAENDCGAAWHAEDAAVPDAPVSASPAASATRAKVPTRRSSRRKSPVAVAAEPVESDLDSSDELTAPPARAGPGMPARRASRKTSTPAAKVSFVPELDAGGGDNNVPSAPGPGVQEPSAPATTATPARPTRRASRKTSTPTAKTAVTHEPDADDAQEPEEQAVSATPAKPTRRATRKSTTVARAPVGPELETDDAPEPEVLTASATPAKPTRHGMRNSTTRAPAENVETEPVTGDANEILSDTTEPTPAKARRRSGKGAKKAAAPAKKTATPAKKPATPKTAATPKRATTPKNAPEPETAMTATEAPRRTRRPSRQEVSDAKPTLGIMFTMVGHDHPAITALGGRQVTTWRDADVLVTDQVRRTVKFLAALAAGKDIVTMDWVTESIAQGQWVCRDDYPVRDEETEGKYAFDLCESQQMARERKLMHGLRVYVVAGTQPAPADMREIIEAAGGEWIDKMNKLGDAAPEDAPEQGAVIVSMVENTATNKRLWKLGHRIYSKELVLTGMLRQELEWAEYELPRP
ncbi:Mediator of DNA damage checkpoint protein 1 [Allomyces arbusculus]|nr:Mediator of DNA damage checkpoint protein 1 [Allomyces arbusculus]